MFVGVGERSREGRELYDEMKRKEANGEKIVIGEPIPEGMKATLEAVSEAKNAEDGKYGAVRERTLWIRYKAEQAQDILDFFTSAGIEFRFVK